jgi:hypothetical protein
MQCCLSRPDRRTIHSEDPGQEGGSVFARQNLFGSGSEPFALT